MEKKRELIDVDVSFISLVSKGANQKTIIWKAEGNEGSDNFQKNIAIQKTDVEKQMVYGIVYSPGEVDSDGDFATAEVIEKMAYDFMKKRKTQNIDKQHDGNPDEGFVAESWITKSGDPIFTSDPVGSWAVGIKVTDTDTWELVKSGEITGLSMAGTATAKDVEEDETEIAEKDKTGGVLNKLVKFIKSKFQKDFNEEYGAQKLWEMYYALTDAIFDILDDADLSAEQKKNKIFESIGQFRNKIEDTDFTKAAKPILDSDTVEAISDLNKRLKKIEKEYKAEDIEMEREEVQKMIDEKVESLEGKIDELQKSLDTGTEGEEDVQKSEGEEQNSETQSEIEKLEKRIEELENATPGSSVKKEENSSKEKDFKGIKFV